MKNKFNLSILTAALLAATSIATYAQTRYVVVSDRLPEVEQAARARGDVVQHRLKYLKGIVVDLPDQAAAPIRI